MGAGHIQRKAHLVFWYESEVQKGGHGQYLDNRGVSRLAETVAALMDLGLPFQAQILALAVRALSAGEPGADWTTAIHESLVDELDAGLHRCTPTVTEALEQHLATHVAEYVQEV